MPEGRLCWWMARCIYLQGTFMGEKAPFRARRAPLLAEGSHICLEGRYRGRKVHPFVSDGRASWQEVPYNASGGKKIIAGLRYSANEDEHWRPTPLAQGRQFLLGRSCQPLQLPRIRPRL